VAVCAGEADGAGSFLRGGDRGRLRRPYIVGVVVVASPVRACWCCGGRVARACVLGSWRAQTAVFCFVHHTDKGIILPMITNHSVSRRVEFLLLAVVLLLTAVLRLSFPGLTEFKADEARLTLLALEMAEGTAFHIRGISSSVGFPNFPMSVWLYSLPLLLWKHVYAATIFTGLLNTLAVLGGYWLVRRYYGVEAALVAALMFAVSPWAIHHSRKIWAQNLLPFFVVGWGISAALAFVERRWRWLIVHFLCLAIAAQAHLAAMALVPVTALLLLIFWRRLNWKLTAVSITLAALTTTPFIYYLLSNGQQFLTSASDPSALPTSARSWDLSAFRMAWRLISGKDIHALAGAVEFRNYLATVPDLTAVYLFWGVLILGGIGLLLKNVWTLLARTNSDPKSTSQSEVSIILLLWLFVPLLLFSLPQLPSELHYLLPIYPVPFMAAGIFVARVPLRWKRPLRGLLVLSAIAHLFVWGQLMRFVEQTATPGGFGTPLATLLEATDLARTRLAETDAQEILIAGEGERPLLDEFPAVYDLLLHDVPHRFVDLGKATNSSQAVFPATPSIILLDPLAGEGAMVYQQATHTTETIPLRTGEGELQILQVDNAIAPQHSIDPPQILTNWAAIAGYDDPIVHADGTATWQLYWYTGEPSPADFHLFTHLLNANGERIGQTDTAVFNATQWQQGDLVVSTTRVKWPDDVTAVRTGMYIFPELTAVSLYDVAGNLAGESLEIQLP